MRQASGVRRTVVVTGILGMAALTAAVVGLDSIDPGRVVVFFVAVAISRASVLKLTRGMTTWSMSAEEAILVPAFLLLSPAEFVLARVAAEPVAQLLKRFRLFSPVPRRLPDPWKLAFGVGTAAVASGIAALGYASVAAAAWSLSSRLIAALVATLVLSVVTSLLVSRVVSLLEGRSWAVEAVRDLRQQGAAMAVSLWAGVVVAVAAALGPAPLLWPLGSAIALAAIARRASEGLLDASRLKQLLRAGTSIHRQSARSSLQDVLTATAADLLHADRVVVREDGPGHGEVGVPFVGRWLVASGRSRRDRPYDEHDEALLEGLAGMAITSHHNAALLEQVQAHDRLKSDLLGAVSHDLRSPLSTAVTALEMMGEGGTDRGGLTPDELIGTSLRSLRRMQRLIDDLLDLQRVEHRVASSARGVCRTWAVIERLAAEHSLLAGTEVQVRGVDASIAVEEAWTARVLENVLVNAAKYSPAGAPVVVDVTDDEDGQVRVTVTDEGPGVPTAARRALLDPFAQLGEPIHGGVGLGLYVTKRFIEHAGGRIEIGESAAGGAAVHLYFPAAPAVAPEHGADTANSGAP